MKLLELSTGVLAIAAVTLALAFFNSEKNLAASLQKNAELVSAAEKAARAKETEIAQVRAQHTNESNQNARIFEQRLAQSETRSRSDADTVKRLRDKIANYRSDNQRLDAGTSAAVCSADRLETVKRLLAEGVELVVEGRSIVERRDAEVSALAGQIALDRAAVEAAAD